MFSPHEVKCFPSERTAIEAYAQLVRKVAKDDIFFDTKICHPLLARVRVA